MAKKKPVRKFVLTITVEEVDADHPGVAHQVPPPLHTRDGEELGWMERQELRKRRRRRTKVHAGD